MTAMQSPAPKIDGQAFWDRNPCGGDWADYAGFLQWIRNTEPYAYEILERYEWHGKRVLDVGCGQGVLLNHLPSLGAEPVGMDMSLNSVQRALEGARELRANGVQGLQGDAERLPFDDGTFDAVISFGVLHHTPDTAGAIRELRRVLRPDGLALVMLYRRGNPKWWMTRIVRGISGAVDRVTGTKHVLAKRAARNQQPGDSRGTALQELLACPTLKAFSNSEATAMFDGFRRVRVENVQPGFARMKDIIQPLRRMEPTLQWIDRNTRSTWGFYQVIEAWR